MYGEQTAPAPLNISAGCLTDENCVW